MSTGFFLKEAHLECYGQDRQDTRLAHHLFNDKVAALFRRYYSKDDDSKMAAADYCDLSFKGRFLSYYSRPQSNPKTVRNGQLCLIPNVAQMFCHLSKFNFVQFVMIVRN